MRILELFCDVDDFCQAYWPHWEQHLVADGTIQRRRATRMAPSELMTLVILFHASHYRTFKAFYTQCACHHLRAEFPTVVSYQRFVELMPTILHALSVYLGNRMGRCTGISFVDSTPLAVCKNARIGQHRVFMGLAQRGHTSVGWFYGFKLHAVINDRGELLALQLTSGNIDDRRPFLPLVRGLFGKVFGDRGYISATLAEDARRDHGIHLIARPRKNMTAPPLDATDQTLLRHRAIIESVWHQLKHECQVEHTRHRSVTNFLVNLISGLIAYCLKPLKPSFPLPA
jgi:hypothetical protein